MRRIPPNKFALNALGILPLKGESEEEFIERGTDLLYNHDRLIQNFKKKRFNWYTIGKKRYTFEVTGEVERKRVLEAARTIQDFYGVNLNWMRVLRYKDQLGGRAFTLYYEKDGNNYVPPLPMVKRFATQSMIMHEMVHAFRYHIAPNDANNTFEEMMADNSLFPCLYLSPSKRYHYSQIKRARKTLEGKLEEKAKCVLSRLTQEEVEFLNEKEYDKFRAYVSWQSVGKEKGLRMKIINEQYLKKTV